MHDQVMKYLALVGSVVAILFVIYISWVILCSYLDIKGIRRRLKSSVFPVISFNRSGRLDTLRDELIERLRNQSDNTPSMIFNKSGFRRPAIAVLVLGAKGKTKCSFLGILIRRNKTSVCLELRSGHPLRRPHKKTCEVVLSQLEKGVISINVDGFIKRLRDIK